MYNENKTNEALMRGEASKRLRECRKDSGLTQDQVAQKVYYTKQYISDLERGKRSISVDAARRLGKCLEVRMEYLLCEDDYKTIADIQNKYFEHGEFSTIDDFGYRTMPLLHPDYYAEKFMVRDLNYEWYIVDKEAFYEAEEEIEAWIKFKVGRLLKKAVKGSLKDMLFYEARIVTNVIFERYNKDKKIRMEWAPLYEEYQEFIAGVPETNDPYELEAYVQEYCFEVVKNCEELEESELAVVRQDIETKLKRTLLELEDMLL